MPRRSKIHRKAKYAPPMTRTTDRLFMTYHRESAFAKRLIAASAKRAGEGQKRGWLKWFAPSGSTR